MRASDVSKNRSGLRRTMNMGRLTEVVDIGANPIDGDPPYKAILKEGLCRVTGFEPQQGALEELLRQKSEYETYLPYAVGDGGKHTLRIYQSIGLTSLLELDPASLSVFEAIRQRSNLNGTEEVQTRRLDEIDEIAVMDFLKIDIQGSELMVFQNGRKKLADTVAIQTEVSFFPLYKNQPGIGDIDVELRSQGFVPHCLAMPLRTGPIAPASFENNVWQGLNQLGEADLVYVRDFRKAEDWSSDMIKHLALIASGCYGSIDLTLRLLAILADRGEIERDIPDRFWRADLPEA
jgi:FkbM family methyltransferase